MKTLKLRLVALLVAVTLVLSSDAQQPRPNVLPACPLVATAVVLAVGITGIIVIIKISDKCLNQTNTPPQRFSAESYVFTVERSSNLVDWETLFTTNAPLGSQFRLEDQPLHQSFYRVVSP